MYHPQETEFRVLKAIPRVHSGASQTYNIFGKKKVTHTETNLQLSAACFFKYV